MPLPVPDKLFWSITVYDAQTRTEIVTDQGHAALRSLIELTPDVLGDAPHAELHFSPEQPPDAQGRGIKTIPGRGWFVYFRIYGPDAPGFDRTWQLPDLQAHELTSPGAGPGRDGAAGRRLPRSRWNLRFGEREVWSRRRLTTC